MLRAVNATGIELVHHLRLRYLDKPELCEKLRGKCKHQRIGRFERLNPLQYGLYKRAPYAMFAERLTYRNGLNLNSSTINRTYFRKD